MAEAAGSPTATHTVCILVIVLTIMGIRLMMPEEGEPWLPAWEDLNPVVMLSPLLLLLLVRFLGSSQLHFDATADAVHRVGASSSTGVLLLLLLIVLAMISFRSLLHGSLGFESE